MTFGSIVEKIFTNWQAKLLSFGLAILVYVAFQIISLDTKSFSIPLEVRSGGNYVLSEDAPSFVRVELQGAPEDIATIQAANLNAYIDIANITQVGTETVFVGLDLEENLTLMDPLEITVTPASIELSFEENTFAWVPVEPSFAGEPLDGYEVVSWETSLKDVKVVGPKSIVETTKAVYADGVDLNEKTQPFTVEASLSAVSDKLAIVTAEVTSVYVEIMPQIVTLTFENIVPALNSLLSDYALAQAIPPVSMEVSGEKNFLASYVLDSNAISVDFSSITELGEYTLPFIVNLPTDTSLVSISSTEATVEVIEAPVIDLAEENILFEGADLGNDDASILAGELE